MVAKWAGMGIMGGTCRNTLTTHYTGFTEYSGGKILTTKEFTTNDTNGDTNSHEHRVSGGGRSLRRNEARISEILKVARRIQTTKTTKGTKIQE